MATRRHLLSLLVISTAAALLVNTKKAGAQVMDSQDPRECATILYHPGQPQLEGDVYEYNSPNFPPGTCIDLGQLLEVPVPVGPQPFNNGGWPNNGGWSNGGGRQNDHDWPQQPTRIPYGARLPDGSRCKTLFGCDVN